MADQYTAWISTSSDDWETSGNWSNGVPDNSSYDNIDVVISQQASVGPATNLDQTDHNTNGLNLRSLRTDAGCTVDVGASGNPLKCLISQDSYQSKLVILGSGSVWFDQEADVTDADLPLVYVDSPNMTSALYLYCGRTIQNITNVIALHGYVNIAAECFVDSVWTDYSRRFPGSGGPVVEIGTASFGMGEISHKIGRLTVTDRQIDEIIVTGGLLTFTGSDFRPLKTRHYGGRMVCTGNLVLPEVIGLGGVLDFEQDYLAKTITRYVHSDDFLLQADLNRVTITQDIPLSRTDDGI